MDQDTSLMDLAKLMILYYFGYLQIFNRNDVVVFDNLRGDLIQIIFTGITDCFMYSGNFDAVLVPVGASFHHA